MAEAVTLAFVGDLMLGRKVSRALATRPPESFWGGALPVLRDADIVFANMECPIAGGRLVRNAWKTFHFHADPAAVEILKAGNVGFANLANNHMMDFGPEGLFQTIQYLDAAGIVHAGAGSTRADAEAGKVIRLPGLTVGVIAATDNMMTFAAAHDRPGTNFIRTILGRRRALDWVRRTAADLRSQGADLVVLALHWGPNMRTAPPIWFRRFARGAIDAGADVVHGHSAHVFHAVERYGDGVILYDTGNFIDDYWKFPFRETYWSFIFLFDVAPDRRWRLRLLPVHIHMPDLVLATGDTFHAITNRMQRLCGAFGTPITKTSQGLEIPGSVLRPNIEAQYSPAVPLMASKIASGR